MVKTDDLARCKNRARLTLAKKVNAGLGEFTRDTLVPDAKEILGWHPILDVRAWVGAELEKWCKRGFLTCVNRGDRMPDGSRPIRRYLQESRITLRWGSG